MTTTASSSTRSGLDRFFESLHKSPIVRSDDAVLAGICGTVAGRLGISTKVVRIAAVVLAFFGPVVAIYLIAWLLLPDSRGRVMVERALRGGEVKAIALTVIAGIALIGDIDTHDGLGWLALIVAAVVAGSLFVRRGSAGGRRGGRTTPDHEQPYAATPPAYTPPSYVPTYPEAPQHYQAPQDAPRA